MEEEQVQQEILEAKAHLESFESAPSTNPLAHFRTRIVPDLGLNGFNKPIPQGFPIHVEYDAIMKCALASHDMEVLGETLWFIKGETDLTVRKASITNYIRVCCSLTDEAMNDITDRLLDHLHQNIESAWDYDIGFLFDLLQNAGVNVEKLISLMTDLRLDELLNDVQLQSKFNHDGPTTSDVSDSQSIQAIRRVFRLVLSLCFFHVEKLKSTLSEANHLFLFLLGVYLQLDKRFQDMNTIHLARRLMVNGITLLSASYWNQKRDLLVECLYNLSSKNAYITELFLKTNERTVRLRAQLALLHVKRLVNMVEHEKKSEASILDEIIQHRLDPRRFAKQTEFIDCVRLLADIIDSYPYDKQIVDLSKLCERVLPYVKKTHEKFLTDEQQMILFDDCARWETMLRPVLNANDCQKLNKRK